MDKIKTTSLRFPYYQASDGIMGLQTSLNQAELQDDAELLEYVSDLSESLDVLRKYMDENYEWD